MARWMAYLWRRVHASTHRAAHEQDLDDEMRFHIEMEAAELARSGVPAAEAMRRARAAFGGAERAKEEWRDGRLTSGVERLARDLRFAARRLRRQPAFSLPVILTLAIGLGSVAAIFALADAVIFRPLPYRDADRLVLVGHVPPAAPIADNGTSEGTYLFYRAGNHTFEEMGAYYERELSLTQGAQPERVLAARVTPSVFSVLAVQPERGRLCSNADISAGQADSAGYSITLISHDLWMRRFGGDPSILGRRVERINRGPTMIVGVMPASFHFPRAETQLWYCMPMSTGRPGTSLYMSSIARLGPGVSVAEATNDLRRLAASLGDRYPDVAKVIRQPGIDAPRAVPFKDAVVRDVRPALVFLLSAAVFVLLVAWANVANLFLARAERHHQLAAIERALGATSWDVARRVFGESAIISVTGGLLALGIAAIAVATRFGFAPEAVPRLHEVHVGTAVVTLTLGLAIASGLLFGFVAFARTSRAGSGALDNVLGGRIASSREWRGVQRALVTIQVALALALVTGSALMFESYRQLARFDLGFDPANTLLADVSLPFGSYPYAASARFYEDALSRIRTLPGVLSAEAGGPPLTPRESSLNFPVTEVGAESESAIAPLIARAALATPGWFHGMRMPVVRGRTYQRGDLLGREHPLVVSASLAAALFGATEPLGRRVRVNRSKDEYTVVGVVGDVPGSSIPEGYSKTLYFPVLNDLSATPAVRPVTPLWPNEMTLFIRATSTPTLLAPAIRRIVHEMDPQVPVAHVHLLDDVVAASMARARLTMLLLAVAATTALVLGMIGIYGVMTYAVSLRTREFGVRMALGATSRDVRRMLLLQNAGVVVLGVAVGLAAAVGITRLLGGLLFQVRPGDPVILIAATGIVVCVAFAATWVPSRRAGSVDLVRALRVE